MRFTHLFVLAACGWGILLLSGCVSGEQKKQLESGYDALKQKQYQQAIAAADRYLAQVPHGPGSPEAFYLRGRALEQRVKASDSQAASDLRAAQGFYFQALQLNPSQPLAAYIHTSLGNTAFYLDDYATAMQQFDQADGKLDKPYLQARVLYLKGLCLQRVDRWREADDVFAQVQRDFPGTSAAQQARLHQGARQFYVQVGAYQSAQSADSMAATLRRSGYQPWRTTKTDRNLIVIMVGPYQAYRQALAARQALAPTIPDAMIIP